MQAKRQTFASAFAGASASRRVGELAAGSGRPAPWAAAACAGRSEWPAALAWPEEVGDGMR